MYIGPKDLIRAPPVAVALAPWYEDTLPEPQLTSPPGRKHKGATTRPVISIYISGDSPLLGVTGRDRAFLILPAKEARQ